MPPEETGALSEDHLNTLVDDGTGGQVTVRSLIDSGRNRSSWEKSLKEKDMELAENRKEISQLVNKVVDNATAQPVTPTIPETTHEPFDIDTEIAALPDAVEDPEGHKRGLSDVMRKQGEHLQRVAEKNAARQDEQRVSQQQREQHNRDADAAAQDNESRCRSWAEKHHPDWTPNQVDDHIKAVGSLHGNQYGETKNFGGIRVLSYNEKAYEDAMKLVPSISADLDAQLTNRARMEGMRQAQMGHQASGEGIVSTPTAKPPANASISEKLEYIRTNMTEDQASSFVSSLPDSERDALMRGAYSLEI